ncbi:MAG TPA: nuclear transport factor 2 family protein [Ferruginibacter sp.]|nr:nuclear transport factor 2 family protein [Ferruginibacter sp.]HMP20352.1 nuclear transport factor 2 family protein [Ferruginibacter sp.]
MDKTGIAKAFSNGDFETAYPYFSEGIVWEVAGTETFTGKAAVIQQCEQVAQYFKSVETVFETCHTITEADTVAITGTAQFLRDGIEIAFVSACDVYFFNPSGFIEKIISYCISKK